MAAQRITVCIIGGSRLEQAALQSLVSEAPGLQVIPYRDEPAPRVLIVDARYGRMPDLPGLNSRTVILILAAGDDFENIPSDATGLISPDEPPEALFAAIRQVARGEQYISPALALSLLHKRSLETNDKPNLSLLSEREAEILDLLASGQGNKSIAAQLYLSVRTVEGHLASIYAKLGVHSRSEAMLIAMRGR